MSAMSFLVSFGDVVNAADQPSLVEAEFRELRETLLARMHQPMILAPFQAFAISPTIELHSNEPVSVSNQYFWAKQIRNPIPQSFEFIHNVAIS